MGPGGGSRMSDLVLHMQKVAGISGSEAHLLSLLPRLRERGWNVRMLMLHEHEPGAWEFARELEARGVPLDAIPLRADVDPLAFLHLAGYLVRHRPALLHTHLVHADVYGQLAGTLARVPLRFSTKHGFNEFREGRGFALADRTVASLAHVHIAISRGLARYLADTEGFDESGFQIVHYGIPPADEPEPYAGPPRLLCIGRLIPIKGHVVLLRALARAREEVPEVELAIAGAIGGLGDIVRDGETGLLVPPAEVEPLARAIVELARDPARAARMGEAGRRRALEHFLEDRATDRTEILYRAFFDGTLD